MELKTKGDLGCGERAGLLQLVEDENVNSARFRADDARSVHETLERHLLPLLFGRIL